MKNLNINIPEGYEIDVENTNLAEGIIELKEIKKDNKRWRAEERSYYWLVGDCGEICQIQEDTHKFDDWMYLTRNYFKTKEEANEKSAQIKKKYEILDRIAELNGNWTPDWGNSNKNEYGLCYNYISKTFEVLSTFCIQEMPDEYHFKSDQIGEQLIKEFGDDLKCLFIL